MNEEQKITLLHTAAQIDEGLDKAYAAAPQNTTYTKDQVDNMIPTVEHITTEDIDNLMA